MMARTASSSFGVGCGGVFFQASTSISHMRIEWKSFLRKNEYDMSLVMNLQVYTRHSNKATMAARAR
jgi:hypothetical protein